MKIRVKHTISCEQADKLITKYYDGYTTAEEEKQVRYFLSQADLPAKYQAEQAIFGYFEKEKPKKFVFIIPNYLKWASSAAVITAIVIGFMFSNRAATANYAYVDGKKITDEKVIISLAQTTVNNLVSINTELEAGLDNIRENDMIESQLDAFSGIEF